MPLSRRVLTSLAAALLVLGGCHGSSTKEITPIVSNAPLKLTFTADVKATATELTVEYTVKNDGDGDVLLINRIATTDVDDYAVYLPGSVYVDLDGDTLRLAKMARTQTRTRCSSRRPSISPARTKRSITSVILGSEHPSSLPGSDLDERVEGRFSEPDLTSGLTTGHSSPAAALSSQGCAPRVTVEHSARAVPGPLL